MTTMIKYIIAKICDFFSNSNTYTYKLEQKNKSVKQLAPFKIDEFNHWFNNEYTGYDGHTGAPGIFLRLDKLSNSMVMDYFIHLGYDEDAAYYEAIKYYLIIRKDWLAKQNDRLH